MAKGTESLEDFYKYKFNILSDNFKKDTGQFNIFRIEDRIESKTTTPTYIRRNFYKIMLFQGDNVFHYGDKSIAVTGNTLLFFNPLVPYTYDPLTLGTKGYFCVFIDEFFKENIRLKLSDLPLFAAGAQPVFHLNEKENKAVQQTFEKIITELNTDYIYKYELVKNYVSELIYMAIKLQPSKQVFQHPDASTRITAVFAELLERQFPIESTSQRFEFRSPKVFAYYH
jgi:AraC family transcriptional activator of pobA